MLLTSAGVAFYCFLSLFPALAALVFIYGLLTDIGSLQNHVAALSSVLPSRSMDVIAERLNFVVQEQNAKGIGLGLIVSLAISFWSGSRGVAALVEVIGVAYRQPDKRSLLCSAALSLVLTLGMLLMLIVTLLAIAGIPAISSVLVLPPYLENLIGVMRWPVMMLAVVLCLIGLYRLAPDRRMAKLRWTIPGAVAATLLWGIMSLGLSVYVEIASDYESTFGALSSIVLLMLCELLGVDHHAGRGTQCRTGTRHKDRYHHRAKHADGTQGCPRRGPYQADLTWSGFANLCLWRADGISARTTPPLLRGGATRAVANGGPEVQGGREMGGPP